MLLDPPTGLSLKRRLQALTPAERTQAGDFLAKVVRGNEDRLDVSGRVGRALLKALELLELDRAAFLDRHVVVEEPPRAVDGVSVLFLACWLRAQLACAVLGAVGGEIDPRLLKAVEANLQEEEGLAPPERQQLAGMLKRMLLKPPGLAPLETGLRALPQWQRERAGELLAQLVRLSPLGFSYGKGRRALRMGAKMLRLPFAPILRGDYGRRGRRSAQGSPPVSLDSAKVGALHKEQVRLTALLEPVFPPVPEEEQGKAQTPSSPGGSEVTGGAADVLRGLDPRSAAFLRVLLKRPRWPQKALKRLAQEHGLPLDGVLERLNEACYEQLDVALFEDGEPLVLNPEAIEKSDLPT